ncbi:MAG: glycosyltransferase [Dehalococcoidia bacterium]
MNIEYFIIHAVFWSFGFFLLFRIPRCTGSTKATAQRHPVISTIIPARNEEGSLPGLLTSLQDSSLVPDEIIVVVDQSQDRTREVAMKQGVTVIDSKPRPQGWVGKPWACYQGALAANGDILMFLDADTCVAKGGLRNIIDTYRARDGIMSVQPYHRTRRLYEQLSGFFNIVMMAAMGAFTVMGELIKPIGLFGPCVVMRKEYYLAGGGHIAVKGEVVEDLALGERFRERELPIHCYGGKGTLSFRMYPNGIRELVDGWSKGFATGAGRTPIPLLLAIVLWIGSGITATGCGIGAISSMNTLAIAAWGSAYLAYAIQVHWMFRRVGTFRFYTALLFPVSLLFFITVFFRSIFLIRIRKSVTWKGIAISLRDRPEEQ